MSLIMFGNGRSHDQQQTSDSLSSEASAKGIDIWFNRVGELDNVGASLLANLVFELCCRDFTDGPCYLLLT
jgi:hypothetical protein